MCGGSDKASKEAQAAEDERKRQIAASMSAINQAYEDPTRAANIADYQSAVQAFLNEDLSRQKGLADRQTRFAMARNGMTGGSADVDANRALSEDYQRGVLEATRKASGAAAGLRSQDMTARNNLIALAQSGMDATTAAQQAAEGIRVNLANAKADMNQQAIGGLFSKYADLYKASQERKGQQDAQKYAASYGLYGTLGGG